MIVYQYNQTNANHEILYQNHYSIKLLFYFLLVLFVIFLIVIELKIRPNCIFLMWMMLPFI